jgi:hypothetical protein
MPYQTKTSPSNRRIKPKSNVTAICRNANQPENEVMTMNMLDNPAFISAVVEKLKAARTFG